MPRTFDKLQRSITWRKGAHTTYPGSFDKTDCERLPQENSTLRNKSNFNTLTNSFGYPQSKKLHPEDYQEMQLLLSHRQQKLQIPASVSATKLSHQHSTTLQCCRKWLYRTPFCQIQHRRTNQSLHRSFTRCNTPGICDRHESRTIFSRVPSRKIFCAGNSPFFCVGKSVPTTVVSDKAT